MASSARLLSCIIKAAPLQSDGKPRSAQTHKKRRQTTDFICSSGFKSNKSSCKRIRIIHWSGRLSRTGRGDSGPIGARMVNHEHSTHPGTDRKFNVLNHVRKSTTGLLYLPTQNKKYKYMKIKLNSYKKKKTIF